MSKPETLELGKLFEATYFGLLIASAQDMDRGFRRRVAPITWRRPNSSVKLIIYRGIFSYPVTLVAIV
jgi:hypothetical protein